MKGIVKEEEFLEKEKNQYHKRPPKPDKTEQRLLVCLPSRTFFSP
jgi:hypothetical protein